MRRPGRRLRAWLFGALLGVVWLGPRGAGALVCADSSASQEVAADSHAAEDFDSASQGVVAAAGIGTSGVGDRALGELGAELLGIRSLVGNAWLLQWDGFLGGKGGYLANEHPYTPLLGGHARAFAELGYRLQSRSPWSLYLGERLAGDLQGLLPLGVSPAALSTINNEDGVGGLSVTGAARVAVGASWLKDGGSSLVVAAFVEEALRAPATNTPGAAFTDVGLTARFDLERSLSLSLDALWGRTGQAAEPALGLSAQTTRTAVAVLCRKVFGNGMWIAGTLSLGRESDHTVYAASGKAYDTAAAPSFALTFDYGLPLGAQQ